MVCLAMTLASLNAWTYAGFTAPPLPPPPPAESRRVTDSARPKAPAQTPLATVQAGQPVESAPRVTRYQLADVSGQVWIHPEPAWLREYVEDRNRQLLAQPR